MRSRTSGSSLIEVIVAITILGLVVVPLCTCLVTVHRINAKSETLLRDQLAASSVMESLQASGIKAGKVGSNDEYSDADNTLLNGDVTVKATKDDGDPFYTVTVTKGEVTFKSVIREVSAASTEGGAGG